jgi:chaperone BCS1
MRTHKSTASYHHPRVPQLRQGYLDSEDLPLNTHVRPPFRRGYLLYGIPGSGKSSLIHALVGELMLDIYVVSLSSSWINDSTLTTLMGRVPSRCIVLLKDLDAAFTCRQRTRKRIRTRRSLTQKSDNEDELTTTSSSRSQRSRNKENPSDVNTLMLSGLINALDGVAAADIRILFAYVLLTSGLSSGADS